jgi:hypothetical protein
MKRTSTVRLPGEVAHFVFAVFDDWDALETVLGDMVEPDSSRSGTVFHARKDNPPPGLRSGLLKEATQLHFKGSNLTITCTRGEVAEELTARLASGARTLAGALHSWLSPDQAWQLQHHLEKGRVVLWLYLSATDEFGAVCGHLVQASPHMVGLCNINFEPQGMTIR